MILKRFRTIVFESLHKNIKEVSTRNRAAHESVRKIVTSVILKSTDKIH